MKSLINLGRLFFVVAHAFSMGYNAKRQRNAGYVKPFESVRSGRQTKAKSTFSRFRFFPSVPHKRKAQTFRPLCNHYPARLSALKKDPTVERPWGLTPSSAKEFVMVQRRVLIDIGHGWYDEPLAGKGPFDTGAAVRVSITEFELNMVTAIVVQERLQTFGHYATFVPFGLSLIQRGMLAKDFDVFLSVHHNATGEHKAQGAEVAVHRTQCTDADRTLGFKIAKSVAGALSIPDRGIVELNLAVLRGARNTNVRAAVLSEGFFLDAPGATRDMCRPEGRAIADAIQGFFAGV